MKKIIKILLGGLLLTSATSCTTIFTGTKQKVHIASEPSGAQIFQDGKNLNAITPSEVKLRKKKNTTITLKKEGYNDGVIQPGAGFRVGPFVGNIILGGIPGMVVDLASGAVWKYDSSLSTTLTKAQSESNNQPEIIKETIIVKELNEPSGQVSRDNPGATELERTIIRWYFDSEPRGARVFWRVVSSIPSVVKNTNQLYLGSTPYEDTRSFNILGLTYENSRDVQIEITLTRPGYMDQVKRFNVRQAIDQQEISSFFDMVKK